MNSKAKTVVLLVVLVAVMTALVFIDFRASQQEQGPRIRIASVPAVDEHVHEVGVTR